MGVLMKTILYFMAFFTLLQAGELQILRLDRAQFVEKALQADPQVQELLHANDKKKMRPASLKADAILPKFEVSMAFGPSPGLKTMEDESGDTISVWDFTKMGPYFGTEIKVAQPLNFGQLLTGLEAARADIYQAESDVDMKLLQKQQEYLQYYYGYVMALEFVRLSEEAIRQLGRAEKRLIALKEAQEKAEEEEEEYEGPTVSQNDILEIRASRFELDKASSDAHSGLRKAQIALHFALDLPDSIRFETMDTLLLPLEQSIPTLDSLNNLLGQVHPDLARLQQGLKALNAQARLEESKMGPEFFLFGSFKYAKSWAGDRRTLSSDAFVRDPVNTLTGSFGLGLRYRLNFWSAREKARMARTEWRGLRYKDTYARRGLEAKLAASYADWQANKEKLESATTSLRATEALLKAQAIRYDLDPSESPKLISAYRRHLAMQKDYLYSVYNYNLSVGDLFAKVGKMEFQKQ